MHDRKSSGCVQRFLLVARGKRSESLSRRASRRRIVRLGAEVTSRCARANLCLASRLSYFGIRAMSAERDRGRRARIPKQGSPRRLLLTHRQKRRTINLPFCHSASRVINLVTKNIPISLGFRHLFPTSILPPTPPPHPLVAQQRYLNFFTYQRCLEKPLMRWNKQLTSYTLMLALINYKGAYPFLLKRLKRRANDEGSLCDP